MARYVVEFVGTLLLMFTIAVVLLRDMGGFGAVTVGTVLTALVYMGGHVSKAHYNPIVTLAFLSRGACRPGDVAPFMSAQLAAAVLGTLLARAVYPLAEVEPAALAVVPAVIGEAVFTFALVLVILNVAIAPTLAGNQFYGVAIGLVVMAGALAVGEPSLASFNPAVSLGMVVLGVLRLSDVWLHVLGQAVGAAAAVAVFAVTQRDGRA